MKGKKREREKCCEFASFPRYKSGGIGVRGIQAEQNLAHELGHHVNRDILFSMIFGTISTTLSLYLASIFLNWSITYFGFTSVADVAAFPALGTLPGDDGRARPGGDAVP